jgi:hypothetical protein
MKKKANLELNPDSILTAEFNYAAGQAFQSNEDRVKVLNFYLGTGFTILVSALFDLQKPEYKAIFGMIFLGLTFFGFTSLLKLIRFRTAWESSLLAMNQIKASIQFRNCF